MWLGTLGEAGTSGGTWGVARNQYCHEVLPAKLLLISFKIYGSRFN